jgi:hypothetical protein
MSRAKAAWVDSQLAAVRPKPLDQFLGTCLFLYDTQFWKAPPEPNFTATDFVLKSGENPPVAAARCGLPRQPELLEPQWQQRRGRDLGLELQRPAPERTPKLLEGGRTLPTLRLNPASFVRPGSVPFPIGGARAPCVSRKSI